MGTCVRCGVEVEEHAERCPLCGAPLGEGLPVRTEEGTGAVEPPVPESKVRRWLWEVISVLALTAAAIPLAIDLADGFRVSWSQYPLSAVAFLWVCATAIIALGRRPLALVAALVAAALVFLFVLESTTTGRPWFLPLAVPLVALLLVVGAGAWAVVSRLRLPVLPSIAVAVLGCGLVAIGVEYFLNRYLRRPMVVSWSLVAMACAMSLFFALLLVHKRLTERHADIRRFFHL